MKVSQYSEIENNDLDSFLKNSPEGFFYHSSKHMAFIDDLLSCKNISIVVKGENGIEGFLPLMALKTTEGTVINSLPYYGSYGGVIATTHAVKQRLLEEYSTIIANPDVLVSTIVQSPFSSVDTPLYKDFSGFNDSRIGQITPIEAIKTMDDLMAVVEASTRRNIRKALKEDIVVSIDNESIPFLNQVHQDNMLAMNGNAKTDQFFETFPKYFTAGVDYNIYVAKQKNIPIAALLVFYFGRTVEYYTPVTIAEARNLQPMAAILAEAIVESSCKGYQYWNWGGTWHTQDGVYKFKKKWGAIDYPYAYHTIIKNHDVLKYTKEELLANFNGFYTVPFSALTQENYVPA